MTFIDFPAYGYQIDGFNIIVSEEYIESSIDSISPSTAQQGETLEVTISGNNMNFLNFYGNYSDSWYNEYSDFELIFSDLSSSYSIVGEIFEDDGQANVTIHIPSDAYSRSYGCYCI